MLDLIRHCSENSNAAAGCCRATTVQPQSDITRHISLNLSLLTKLGGSYLGVIYKSDFHAARNFAGVHAEGKHVIQGSSHVSDNLCPLNSDTGALIPGRRNSDTQR